MVLLHEHLRGKVETQVQMNHSGTLLQYNFIFSGKKRCNNFSCDQHFTQFALLNSEITIYGFVYNSDHLCIKILKTAENP